MDNEQILVSVLCAAYNHERYIRQALESFVTQKVSFRFEVLIHDDASTDQTKAIIEEYARKYPDIIVPVYQTENQYSKGVRITEVYLYPRVRGKYVAHCEGDDFWTDAEKLQRQVDFLEAHPEYSMCAHGAYYALEDGTLKHDQYMRPFSESRTIEIDEILSQWRFATGSIMYRKELGAVSVPYRGDCVNGDFALVSYLALQGKVYYFNELWSAYRIVSIGSLNWQWKKDSQRQISVNNKLIAMLERIDDYSNHQYHDAIKSHIELMNYENCIAAKDYKSAKRQNKKRYKQISFRLRVAQEMREYHPKMYSVCRTVYRIIKKNRK